MLRTDYSKYYPVAGSALNRTNEAINADEVDRRVAAALAPLIARIEALETP